MDYIMNARTETLAEVIDWLGDEADREWERAKDGLSDGYGGFDAYTRAIQHCQDMIVEDEASSGKHTEIALLKHLADTFDERLHKAERAKDRGAGYTYNDGRSDAFGVGGDLLPPHDRTDATARRKGIGRCMTSPNGSSRRAGWTGRRFSSREYSSA